MRPTRRAARIRRVTRSTRPTSTVSTAAAVFGERPSACCEPIEPRRRPIRTGRRVAVVRERVQVTAGGAAEQRDERALVEPRDLPDRRDPARPELPRRDRPDAPEPLDRERMQEGELAVRRHDEQAVGLRDAARHLGEELRPRDADRDRQPDALEHVALQPQRRSRSARRRAAASRERRGTPRRSRAPRRTATCRRTPCRRPCSPRSRRRSAAGRRSRAGRAVAACAPPIAEWMPYAFAS